MTKEERSAAFKNYRIEIIDSRIYAVVTVDFGRKPNETHIQDMYQRLTSETDKIRSYWLGTTLAADHARASARMTKEEWLAAVKNYRIAIIDGRIYAVVTIEKQDMYQRLSSETAAIRGYWHGTTLAADHKHDERESRMQALRETRSGFYVKR